MILLTMCLRSDDNIRMREQVHYACSSLYVKYYICFVELQINRTLVLYQKRRKLNVKKNQNVTQLCYFGINVNVQRRD